MKNLKTAARYDADRNTHIAVGATRSVQIFGIIYL